MSAIGVEKSGGAFTRVIETEKPLRARYTRGQGGLEETLKVDGEVVGFSPQVAPAFAQASERTAAQVSIASYNRPTIQLTVVK